MSGVSQEKARKILKIVTKKIGKTSWYFNLHYYRLIHILTIILNRRNSIKNEKALELGVWPGYLALSLKEAGFFVSGIDFDSTRIKRISSQAEIKNYNLNNSPLKIPYPSNYFNWIVASEIIEHINPNNLSSLLIEIKRLLQNKGLAIITTPNKNSLHNFIFRKKIKTKLKNGHGHLCEYSSQELQTLIENSSLKIIKLKNINFYSNIGTVSESSYFYPLSHFWKYSNKFFNWLKFFILPFKKIPFFKDSIFILVQKND